MHSSLNFLDRLGVQSYCFQHLQTNTDLAKNILETGYSRMELCGVHVDFHQPELVDKAIEFYKKSNIEISSIGVNVLKKQPNDRNYFEFAKKVNLKAMTITFPASLSLDQFRAAEDLAEEYDINLAIHNHGGKHWLGNAAILREVFKNTSKRIGLCLDTAWAIQSGEDVIKIVTEFGERLYGLHLKDFVFERSGKVVDALFGEGNLKLPELLQALEQIQFRGYAIVEYEGPPETVNESLKKCLASIKRSLPSPAHVTT
jgi:inosose dehydratase